MIVLKVTAKIIAFILFVALAIVCMLMKILEYVGVKVVAVCLNILILFAIIAIVLNQWMNLAIFGAMIVAVLLVLVLFTLVNFFTEDRKEDLKRFVFSIK